MRVRLGETARNDLELLLDQIASVDPERAWLTNRAIRAAARSIGAAPMLGPAVGPSRSIRKKVLPPYCLLYAIRGEEVVILRIVHQRSDWVSLV